MKSKYVRLRTPHLFSITYYLFTAAKGRLSGTGLPVPLVMVSSAPTGRADAKNLSVSALKRY